VAAIGSEVRVEGGLWGYAYEGYLEVMILCREMLTTIETNIEWPECRTGCRTNRSLKR